MKATATVRPTASTHPDLTLRGTGNSKDIVERHGHIRDNDLHQRSAEAHTSSWRQRVTRHAARESWLGRWQPDLAIHFPAYPQQQDAAGKRLSNNREELRRHDRKQDSQHHGAGDAPEDDAHP